MSKPDLPDMPIPREKMRGLAVAWMKKEDWPRWLSIDKDFQPDYEHWLGRVEAAFAHYQRLGHKVEKIVVDPDEFLEWSSANGGKVDSNARSAFAAYKMMRKATDH